MCGNNTAESWRRQYKCRPEVFREFVRSSSLSPLMGIVSHRIGPCQSRDSANRSSRGRKSLRFRTRNINWKCIPASPAALGLWLGSDWLGKSWQASPPASGCLFFLRLVSSPSHLAYLELSSLIVLLSNVHAIQQRAQDSSPLQNYTICVFGFPDEAAPSLSLHLWFSLLSSDGGWENKITEQYFSHWARSIDNRNVRLTHYK